MRVMVDAYAHVRVLERPARVGQQVGEIDVARVGRALGHGENEFTVAAHRGGMAARERRQPSGQPAEADEVALVESHERDEAARPGAPGDDGFGVGEQHVATITHEARAASAITARNLCRFAAPEAACNFRATSSAHPTATVTRATMSCSMARLARRGRDLLRSEEHTSELQSRFDLVCRLLLEKKKIITLTRAHFIGLLQPTIIMLT